MPTYSLLVSKLPPRSFLFATRPFPLHLYKPVQSFSKGNGEDHGHGMDIKAPSTADEFERVAMEKAKVKGEEHIDEQHNARQCSEKVFAGSEDARVDVDAAKRRDEKHEAGTNSF